MVIVDRFLYFNFIILYHKHLCIYWVKEKSVKRIANIMLLIWFCLFVFSLFLYIFNLLLATVFSQESRINSDRSFYFTENLLPHYLRLQRGRSNSDWLAERLNEWRNALTFRTTGGIPVHEFYFAACKRFCGCFMCSLSTGGKWVATSRSVRSSVQRCLGNRMRWRLHW